MANNKNTKDKEKDNELTEEQQEVIAQIAIIKEKGEAKPYKISNSNVQLDIDVKDPKKSKVSGTILSEVLINDTELDYIKTWRFSIKNIVIKNLSLDSASGKIAYLFDAESYVIEE